MVHEERAEPGRFYSIDAIASYSHDKQIHLKELGIDATGLPPDEKAKIAYIMHHEGRGDGPLYLQGKLGQTLKSTAEKSGSNAGESI